MNKTEVLNKLKNLPLDKNKVIIISGASLVLQDIVAETPDIDMCTSTEYFNTINWPTFTGSFNKAVKRYDVFDISNNLYNKNANIVEINGFKCLNIEDVLKIKKMLNRPKDKELIKKLEIILKK